MMGTKKTSKKNSAVTVAANECKDDSLVDTMARTNKDADREDADREDADRDDSEMIIDIDSDTDEEWPEANLPVPKKTQLPSLMGPRQSINVYIREISRFPILSAQEEYDLAMRVRDQNDPNAAFKLVSSHLRLVVSIAMEFQRRWMQNVLDLIQEGNVGLMRAVNKFDPTKGIKFSYYASFWIKAYILKFIMDNWRMVKIGTTPVQRKLFYNLNRERQKLIDEGFDPDSQMLSERLGVSEEQINEMNQRMSFSDMSLNSTLDGDNENASRIDFLPALGPGIEDSLASDEIVRIVRSRLKTILPFLNDKEQFILKKRLLSDDPLTLREIGERYKITRERVRQLEARLLEKLKNHFSIDIKDFSNAWIQQ